MRAESVIANDTAPPAAWKVWIRDQGCGGGDVNEDLNAIPTGMPAHGLVDEAWSLVKNDVELRAEIWHDEHDCSVVMLLGGESCAVRRFETEVEALGFVITLRRAYLDEGWLDPDQ
jgi:hypothetical protein